MNLSGYSFIHNGIEGGYPFVEAIQAVEPHVDEIVIVDMESTDGTRDILKEMNVTIIDGKWGNSAGVTLQQAHDQYIKCQGDVIVHFEADEVYDNEVIRQIKMLLHSGQGIENILIHRLQVEQNFQRIRWYPELVHRVFPRLSNARKQGHTTDRHSMGIAIPPKFGFLWDCTNCFRDNYLQRINQQAELRQSEGQYILTPLHSLHQVEIGRDALIKRLEERHWTWETSPLKIPEILQNLIGCTSYNPRLNLNYDV